MTATTRGPYSTTSGTRISSTQFAIPSFRPPASETSGRIDCTVAPGWSCEGHRERAGSPRALGLVIDAHRLVSSAGIQATRDAPSGPRGLRPFGLDLRIGRGLRIRAGKPCATQKQNRLGRRIDQIVEAALRKVR